MFEMVVNDVLSIGKVFSVSGECNGIAKLKPGTLKDETGKEYLFSIPFIKPLVHDESRITIQLLDSSIDINALIGRKLTQ